MTRAWRSPPWLVSLPPAIPSPSWRCTAPWCHPSPPASPSGACPTSCPMTRSSRRCSRPIRSSPGSATAGEALAVPVLIEPRHLDRLEDLLVGRLGVVGEARQLRDVAMQVGEAHRERIDLPELLAQRDADVLRISPLHHSGISTTTSP